MVAADVGGAERAITGESDPAGSQRGAERSMRRMKPEGYRDSGASAARSWGIKSPPPHHFAIRRLLVLPYLPQSPDASPLTGTTNSRMGRFSSPWEAGSTTVRTRTASPPESVRTCR